VEPVPVEPDPDALAYLNFLTMHRRPLAQSAQSAPVEPDPRPPYHPDALAYFNIDGGAVYLHRGREVQSPAEAPISSLQSPTLVDAPRQQPVLQLVSLSGGGAPPPTALATETLILNPASLLLDQWRSSLSADQSVMHMQGQRLRAAEEARRAPTPASKTHKLVCEFIDQWNDWQGDDDAPKEYCCPLSLHAMQDPVTASDGHSYERNFISRTCAERGASPLTREALDSNMMPNKALVSLMERWARQRCVIEEGSTLEETLQAWIVAHAAAEGAEDATVV